MATKKKAVRWRYWLDGRDRVWRTSDESIDAITYIHGYRDWYVSGVFRIVDIETLCKPITAAAARRIIKGGGKC